MDELGFVCIWNKSVDIKLNITCRLSGLYLEGCAFNGVSLVESAPESPPIMRVPDCTIAWVPLVILNRFNIVSKALQENINLFIIESLHTKFQGDLKTYKTQDTLSVPLYNSSSRQTLIVSLEFPSNADNSKWIKAGVGLFLKS